MNIKIALKNEKMLRAVLWIWRKEFYELLPLFEKSLMEYNLKSRKNRQRAIWWWRKWVLRTIEEKLFMILFYIKHYPTYDVLAFLYWVARSKPYYWVVKYIKVLEKALWKKVVLPKRKVWELEKLLEENPHIKEIFIDWTEREINRPKKDEIQRKYYSWKKKRHTVKNTVITDKNKKILYVWETKEWRMHDKKLYDEEGIWRLVVRKYWDTWYVWWEGIITPIKRKRWKKLTKKEKENNRILNSFRTVVEHWIWSMKVFWIVKSKYRNRIYGKYKTVEMDMKSKIMLIAGWLSNLRLEKRRCNTE